MKQKPEIQALKVPDNVYVDMHNGSDYVKVPVGNLDPEEISVLLTNFIEEFIERAGFELTDVEINFD